MQDSIRHDALDAALIHALQLQPRAPWSRIGRVLGVDASTAMRRWERLRNAGEAWITAYPRDPEFCTALVEVECQPSALLSVAATMAREARILTVELTAGARDLFVTVGASDYAGLSRYALEEFGGIPALRGTRTHLISQIASDGSDWQLGGLHVNQQALLRRTTLARPDAPFDWHPADRRLVKALAIDGRQPFQALADLAETTVHSARRRVLLLMTERRIVFRCEVARQKWGWPVAVYLWLQTPPSQLRRSVRYIQQLRETRLCAATASGPHSLVCAMWLRSLPDLHRIELQLTRDLPELVIYDRSLVLGVPKLMGTILDAQGLRVETVPPDFWDDNPASSP